MSTNWILEALKKAQEANKEIPADVSSLLQSSLEGDLASRPATGSEQSNLVDQLMAAMLRPNPSPPVDNEAENNRN
jgi:hypothetical protein